MLCEAEGITAVVMTITEVAEHQKRRGLWPMCSQRSKKVWIRLRGESQEQNTKERGGYGHTASQMSPRCSILCMTS